MGGECPAPLYVLVKDHKKLNLDGTYPTRPVVSGCLSYNTGLYEMTSEAIEAVVRCGGSQNSSLISTDE